MCERPIGTADEDYYAKMKLSAEMLLEQLEVSAWEHCDFLRRLRLQLIRVEEARIAAEKS